MKLQGIVGTGSGKLGASVFVVRHGEQIVRAYQPVVSDAKSASQLVVRAKMKLMVQLAATLSQGLGFKRDGNVSPRNRFFSSNFGKCTMVGDEARIDATQIDISGGVIGLSGISASRNSNNVALGLYVSEPQLDRMVYMIVVKSGTSSFVRNVVVAEPGSDYLFTASTSLESSLNGYVLAYGFRFLDKAAHVRFDNLMLDNQVYALSYLRTLYESQAVNTITRYADIPVAG